MKLTDIISENMIVGEGKKASKKEAGYIDQPKNNQKCINCSMWRDPHYCSAVAGKISPNGWCEWYNAGSYGKHGHTVNEGPTWDRVKKTAATGALAAGLGMGGAHLATKAPSNPTPIAKPAATMQAEPSQPLAVTVSKDVPKDEPKTEPKVDEKPIPSTVNAADPEMEKVVFSAAWRSGLRGEELAQFMAQTAHETLGFQRMVEQGDSEYFKKYDPKHSPQKAKILGNIKPGDGARYKGRGFIQITGRYNYKQAGKALNLPLEEKPQLASDPKIAAQIAVWYWKSRVQNAVDDYGDTIGVTSRINPSMSGLGDRDLNFHKYLERLKPIMNRG